MSWTDDLNACAAIVEKGDPARFRTVMAAPISAREKLFPLYAFNVEVSRAPWVTAEPMIAEMRLQWWRDALEEIAEGRTVRRHEVVTPLASILTQVNAKALDELVTARSWDCYKESFDDSAHLTRYIAQTSGLLMAVAAEVLGADTPVATEAGFALGVANWLRAIPQLEDQKRVPLVDGSADGVRAFARQGLDAWNKARAMRVAKQVRPALWPATGCDKILKSALRNPALVAQGKLPETSRTAFALKAAFARW